MPANITSLGMPTFRNIETTHVVGKNDFGTPITASHGRSLGSIAGDRSYAASIDIGNGARDLVIVVSEFENNDISGVDR
jgi:hypothetical protein